MTEDERLDALARRTLMESRRPPAPPLDDMWAQIERRAFDEPRVRSVALSRGSRWSTPLLAAAAALAIGVALGRYVVPPQHHDASHVAVSMRPSVAPTPVVTPVVTSSIATPQVAANDNAAHPPRTSIAATISHKGRHVAAATQPDAGVGSGPLPDASAVRLAAQLDDVSGGTDMSHYLMRTAALLRALPSDHAAHTSAASDTVIADRAGELLTETHLLLDSQAGSDPTLHRLLEDLELVLAQVARLRAPRSGPDLQLIHQALAFRDVLPRVHDAAVEASITN